MTLCYAKHIVSPYLYLRHMVLNELVMLEYVNTHNQQADILHYLFEL